MPSDKLPEYPHMSTVYIRSMNAFCFLNNQVPVSQDQWIFVLDKSGKKAYRRKITIGRQNPQYYEVIEGLEPGEQVIVSGYEAYKDNDVLVFN